MSTLLQSLFNKDTLDTITEWLKRIQQKTNNAWKSSKYLRVISIATASITGTLLARNLYVLYHRKYYNLPPGPLGLPFVGHIFSLFNPTSWKTVAPLNKYGPVATINLGPIATISISNPYLIKKIYSDPRTLDNRTDFFQGDLFLTTVNGKTWSKRRKIIFANIMSAMNASFVEDSTKSFIFNKLFPIYDKQINNNQSISMKDPFRAIGFNIVLHSCFGKELESLKDPFWIQYGKKMDKMRNNRVILLLLMFFFNKKLANKIRNIFGIQSFLDIFKDIMVIVEEFAVSDKHSLPNKDMFKDKNIKFFKDYIKQYNNDDSLTRQHLLGDMMIMMQASTDTTYMGLAFAILEAAKNPNIQEELHKELVDAFGDIDNIHLINNGIFKIPKLRAFIHEVLRIHSPAPISGFREINDDNFEIDTKKYGGNNVYNVPKGTSIMMNVMAISHEPKWWIKDYDPINNIKHKNINMNDIHYEFWIDNDGKFSKKRNSDLFLIFSRGKRDCIGQALAMKVLYIALAMIFMKYKISVKDNDFEIKINGATVTIEPNEVTLEIR